MLYEDRIRRERPDMSKSFAKLADFLLNSYIEAAFMTASELAHALNLDAATVVRFSQFLGYTGFPELQREIRERVKGDLLIRPKQAEVADSAPGIVAGAMQDLVIALEQTRITSTQMPWTAWQTRWVRSGAQWYWLKDQPSPPLIAWCITSNKVVFLSILRATALPTWRAW